MNSSETAVAWGRVGLYYLIAVGIASATAGVMLALGANLIAGEALLAFQLLAAFVYMPAPLVAGLVVDRVAKRPSRLRAEFAAIRANWKRVIGVSAVAVVGIYLAEVAFVYVLGNLAGIPGVGSLVFTAGEIFDNIRTAIPSSEITSTQGMPPALLLYVIAPVVAVIAGFTMNGLFAFGEEFGWRGVLADELAPLGPVRANLLTGVMWGLWHAPIIALGFNYGAERALGIFAMWSWVTPLSFILWRSREYAGGAIAPAAIIHGGFNAFAGFFLFFVADRAALVSAPVGLASALALTLVAVVAWRVLVPRAVSAPSQTPVAAARAAAISSNAR